MRKTRRIGIVLVALLLASSFSFYTPTAQTTTENAEPTADAGPNLVVLDGGASDKDGQRNGHVTLPVYGTNSTDPDYRRETQISCQATESATTPEEELTYEWELEPVRLDAITTPIDATGPSPLLEDIPLGLYTLHLTVTDSCGQSDKASAELALVSTLSQLDSGDVDFRSHDGTPIEDLYEQEWDGRTYLETKDPLRRIHGANTSDPNGDGLVNVTSVPRPESSPEIRQVLGNTTNEAIRVAMQQINLTTSEMKEAINRSLEWNASLEKKQQAALEYIDEGDYLSAAASLTGTFLDISYYCGDNRQEMVRSDWIMIIPTVLSRCDTAADDDAVVNMMPTRLGLCAPDLSTLTPRSLLDGLDATLVWYGLDTFESHPITGFKYMGHNLGTAGIDSNSFFTGDFSLHGLCGNNIIEDLNLCTQLEPGGVIGDPGGTIIIDDSLEPEAQIPHLCHPGLEGSIEFQFHRQDFQARDRLIYTKGGWMTKGKTAELVFETPSYHDGNSNDHQRLDFVFQDKSNGWNLNLDLHDERAYDKLQGHLRFDGGDKTVDLEFCKDVSWGDQCRFPSTSFVTLGYGKMDRGPYDGGEKRTVKLHFERGTSGLKDSLITGTFRHEKDNQLEKDLDFLIKGIPDRNFLRMDTGEDPETRWETEDATNITSLDLTKKQGENRYRNIQLDGVNRPWRLDMAGNQVNRLRFAKGPDDIMDDNDQDQFVSFVSALDEATSQADARFQATDMDGWKDIVIDLAWSDPGSIYYAEMDCGFICDARSYARGVNTPSEADYPGGNLWAQGNTENAYGDINGGLEFQNFWGTSEWPCPFHEDGICS